MNKYINCHPEPLAQRVEGSQQNHITADARLNIEIAEELRKFKTNHQLSSSGLTRGSRSNKDSLATWILRSSRSMTRMYALLPIITLLPTLAQAETCTATPDCKTLGYTETSCPDNKGVRCPWNTNLMHCCKKCEEKNLCQSCYVGWILNSDMTCSYEEVSGKTPIGVVFQQTITTVGTAVKCQGIAIALNDSGRKNWSDAKSACSYYSAGGVRGWRLPTKEELIAVYGNRKSVLTGLSNAGGSDFSSYDYWSSSDYSDEQYWTVDLINGRTDWAYDRMYYDHGSRPVLAF